MREYTLASTPEYEEWEESLPKKEQHQIAKRLALIQEEGHFGDCHSVSKDNEIWELRWGCGRRVYYSIIRTAKVLLILGGSKNGQEKDIERAKGLLKKRRTS